MPLGVCGVECIEKPRFLLPQRAQLTTNGSGTIVGWDRVRADLDRFTLGSVLAWGLYAHLTDP